MTLKQEIAAEDSVAVIEGIARHFGAMGLPLMADARLYLGTPLQVLEGLCKALDEQRSSDEKKRFQNRMRYAGIARERTEDAFKWGEDTYPLAAPGVIESALSIEFVTQKRNLVVAGPPGVGKSSLVTVIACKAIRAGFSLKYKTAHDIVTGLREARAGNSLSGYIKKLQSCDALVIDDVTYATFDRKTAESFFSVIDGRYGRKSTIIASNGSINEWAADFPDKRMSSAMLGRFYEEALLINMNGAEDMRLKLAKSMLGDTYGNAGRESV
jgi:DNA replication protein DnaC